MNSLLDLVRSRYKNLWERHRVAKELINDMQDHMENFGPYPKHIKDRIQQFKDMKPYG